MSQEPIIIQTILGSCVAVCLFDERNQIGGMNHFMLPFWNGDGLASPKFGNIAIDRLLQSMLKKGAQMNYIKAKIFGGGAVINYQSDKVQVGERNIIVAETAMAELNIPIVNKSVGGKLGRKILFNTKTGVVKMKYINRIKE